MEDKDDGTTILISAFIVMIFLFGVYLAVMFILNDFSVILITIAYKWVSLIPNFALNFLFIDYQLEKIITLYNQSIYRASDSQTISRISAFITIFQWPIFYLLYRSFKKYRLKTLPFTFVDTKDETNAISRKLNRLIVSVVTLGFVKPSNDSKAKDIQIKGVDDLVRVKQARYPVVKLPYNYQKAHLHDDFDQRWGKFSMEEGPIRWCIKRGLVSFGQDKLGFSDFESTGLRVDDDIKQLSRFSNKLDINLNKLSFELKKQLGSPYTGIDSLCNEYIALTVMFLLYSKGIENKKNALEYKNFIANSCQILNVGNNKKEEVWAFNFNRSKGLKKLKKLLDGSDSKLINSCRTDYQFILSCYHYARLKHGDITPPDFQWLMYFNREAYLLLHCYNGNPSSYNNSPYIEVCAPLNSWSLLYAAVEKDDEKAASNKLGTIDTYFNWQNVFSLTCLKVINGKYKSSNIDPFSLSRKIDIAIKKSLLANNIDSTAQDIMEKDKIISSVKLSKKDHITIRELSPDLPRSYLNHQLMILYINAFDHLIKDSSSMLKEFIRNLSWVYNLNSGLYLQMITMMYLMQESGLSAHMVLKNIVNGPAATTKLTSQLINRVKNTYLQLPLENFNFVTENDEHSDDESYFNNPLYIPLESAVLDFTLYAQSIEDSQYSSEQLLNLISSDWYAIRQSIKSILFYMTNTESWLLDKYSLDQEQMLGSPSIKVEYFKIT